jgi:hypothetical protein
MAMWYSLHGIPETDYQSVITSLDTSADRILP